MTRTCDSSIIELASLGTLASPSGALFLLAAPPSRHAVSILGISLCIILLSASFSSVYSTQKQPHLNSQNGSCRILCVGRKTTRRTIKQTISSPTTSESAVKPFIRCAPPSATRPPRPTTSNPAASVPSASLSKHKQRAETQCTFYPYALTCQPTAVLFIRQPD